MNSTARQRWLETCAVVSEALGLERGGEPPINLMQFIYQQRREKVKNPTSQVFSGKTDLYDDDGNIRIKGFSWGGNPIEKVELAIAEGYWPLIERVLYCSSPIFEMSARGWLTMQVIGELNRANGQPPAVKLLDGTELSKKAFKKYFAPLIALAPASLQAIAGDLAPREKVKKGKEPQEATFEVV